MAVKSYRRLTCVQKRQNCKCVPKTLPSIVGKRRTINSESFHLPKNNYMCTTISSYRQCSKAQELLKRNYNDVKTSVQCDNNPLHKSKDNKGVNKLKIMRVY